MDDRFKVGLIVPSSNSVMEVDFYKNLPPKSTLHVGRMYLKDTTVKGEEEMLDVHFPKALYDLSTVKPRIIVFGCTSAGALRGNAYDETLCKKIEEVGACVSVSVIASVRKKITEKKLKKIGVLTPYIAELNKRIKSSLEADGVMVSFIDGMNIDFNHAIGMVSPQEIIDYVKKTYKEQDEKVDGLFLSCTNFRAMEVYEELEQGLGIPVFTSNQVAVEAVKELVKNYSL